MVVREVALMVAFLLQGAFAEKSASLRASKRKSKEAMPLITLPESLLLQGESGDSVVDQASSSRSDYASNLLNSIEESAAEIVGDARNAFFGSRTGVPSASNTPGWNNGHNYNCEQYASMKWCVNGAVAPNAAVFSGENFNWPEKHCSACGKQATCDEFKCPDGWQKHNIESTTYTQANCCEDVAAYAASHHMSLDNAKSRIMLITMIEHAQVDLMNRLQEIGMDLEATDARAKYDLQAINATALAAKSMPIMANNAEADVNSVQHNAQNLLDTIAGIVNKTINNTATMDELDGLKNATQKDAGAAANLASGQRRVQANSNTMHALVPRLMQLQRRIARLESSLNDGNISRMVDDTANQEVMNLMEDVSRAFGRFIRNKRTL